MRVIFCRTTHHCRTTDVDQFNRRFSREWIEIGDDKINRFDTVLLHVGAMFGVGRVGQDAAVNLRMQRDNAVTENCRESSEISNIGDGNSSFGNDARGATA